MISFFFVDKLGIHTLTFDPGACLIGVTFSVVREDVECGIVTVGDF